MQDERSKRAEQEQEEMFHNGGLPPADEFAQHRSHFPRNICTARSGFGPSPRDSSVNTEGLCDLLLSSPAGSLLCDLAMVELQFHYFHDCRAVSQERETKGTVQILASREGMETNLWCAILWCIRFRRVR